MGLSRREENGLEASHDRGQGAKRQEPQSDGKTECGKGVWALCRIGAAGLRGGVCLPRRLWLEVVHE